MFTITLSHIIIFLYTIFKESRLKSIAHYLFILFNSIFTLPFLITNASIIICASDNPFCINFTCYSGIHIFYVVMACFNLAWIVSCTLFVFLFYQDRNLLSSNLFAASSNLWLLAKFIMKLAPVIFIVADPNLSFGVLYSIGFAGLNFAIFGALKVLWPYFHSFPMVENFKIRC